MYLYIRWPTCVTLTHQLLLLTHHLGRRKIEGRRNVNQNSPKISRFEERRDDIKDQKEKKKKNER